MAGQVETKEADREGEVTSAPAIPSTNPHPFFLSRSTIDARAYVAHVLHISHSHHRRHQQGAGMRKHPMWSPTGLWFRGGLCAAGLCAAGHVATLASGGGRHPLLCSFFVSNQRQNAGPPSHPPTPASVRIHRTPRRSADVCFWAGGGGTTVKDTRLRHTVVPSTHPATRWIETTTALSRAPAAATRPAERALFAVCAACALCVRLAACCSQMRRVPQRLRLTPDFPRRFRSAPQHLRPTCRAAGALEGWRCCGFPPSLHLLKSTSSPVVPHPHRPSKSEFKFMISCAMATVATE